MNFIPKDQIEWKKVKYLKTPLSATDEQARWECEFWLPEPLASWDVFSYWEAPRFFSMKARLKQGDVLFDVGTEQGWLNLAYASIVGAENMVLIEPTKEFWPNIKQTWEKNSLSPPKDCFVGLLGEKEKMKLVYYKSPSWPPESEGHIIDRNKYQYIHDNDGTIKETTLDRLVDLYSYAPDALTIDVEGAELLVLRGAEDTLKIHKPKIWVSVHPDLALRDYGVQENELDDYLKSLGYTGEHLATDHEEHWYYV